MTRREFIIWAFTLAGCTGAGSLYASGDNNAVGAIVTGIMAGWFALIATAASVGPVVMKGLPSRRH